MVYIGPTPDLFISVVLDAQRISDPLRRGETRSSPSRKAVIYAKVATWETQLIFSFILAAKIAAICLLSHFAYDHYFIPFLRPTLDHHFSPFVIWVNAPNAGGFPYGITMASILWPFTKLFSFFGQEGFGLGLSVLCIDIMAFFLLVKGFKFSLKKTLWIYWASPILFYICYWHGQLDIIPIFLLLASAYFVSQYRFFLSGLLLALAINAKASVLLGAPILLWTVFLRSKTRSVVVF